MTPPARLPLSRIAAYAILLSFVLVGWFAVVMPLWSAWSDRVEQVDRLADLAARLRSTAAEAPSVQAELDRLGQEKRTGSAIWAAANPVLAGAALQSEVRRIVEAAGAQAQSVQPLPVAQEKALSRIGLRVNLQTGTAQIARILSELETHVPVMLVRSLSIRGNEQSQQSPGTESLTVQFEVTSFTAAPG